MLRILILEDELSRRMEFLSHMLSADAVPVTRVQTAIKLLEEEEWDYLFLDHDLGDHWREQTDDNTGYGVAVWLEELLNTSRSISYYTL